MEFTLRYGDDSQLEFELSEETLVGSCTSPGGISNEELAQAVTEALRSPLEYPPLSQAVVPGDRVVLAVVGPLAPAAVALRVLIDELVACQVAPSDITIVQSQDGPAPRDDAKRFRQQLSEAVRNEITFETHDAKNREGLAYLAADAEGRPVMLNRRLVDADLVIPVGVAHLSAGRGHVSVHDFLYPAFADADAQQRHAATIGGGGKVSRRRDAEDAANAEWLLGVQFIVQIVPADDRHALAVLAGLPGPVFEQANQLYLHAWAVPTEERAAVVVAAVPGNEDQQTWNNVGQALAAAGSAVEQDGVIVLCTTLSKKPGNVLQAVGQTSDLSEARAVLRKSTGDDAFAARRLAMARERARVFLLSELAEETVAELGLGYIHEPEEVVRLAERSKSCLLLGYAQYAQPRVESEHDD